MKVRLIDVNVSMGYADKLTPAQQKIAEMHPELRVLPTEDAQRDPPFGFRYYPPAKYAVGEENRQNSWRILAICPQPDARRPDYIMGRVAQAETPKFSAAKRWDDV